MQRGLYAQSCDKTQPTASEARRLRICHIISSYRPIIGGAERATETLVGRLAEQGQDVIVLTRRKSASVATHEVINGVPVHRLGLPGRSKLHAATFGLHALAVLATRYRHYRILHVQNIDTPMIVGMLARLLPGRRLVATIHGEAQLKGRRRNRRGRLRLRAMARTVDQATSINPENTREWERVGLSPEQIHEIPNGIDESVYRPPSDDEKVALRGSLGLEQDELVVLYLGRLRPIKRVDLLIGAWSLLDGEGHRRLVIVGEGPEEEALRQQAGTDETIRFDGPTDDPVSYMRAADIFVNASDSEGLSVALLEASFVGLFCIATAGPGNDVIIKDGVTGLSFPVGDRDALVTCLKTAADADLRRRIGAQAHDAVAATYAAGTVAGRVAKVYRQLEGRS